MAHGEKVGKGSDGRPLGGARPGAGRKPGVPNKVTREFREIVNDLLQANADNFAKWVTQVAEGMPAVLDEQGKVIHPARQANPAEAARLVAMFAEYAAPKLTRAEVTGEGGGALNVVIHKLG